MNLDRIEAILRLLQRQDHVEEISVEGEGWRLRARKGAGFLSLPLEEIPPVEEAPAEPRRHVIRASRVGIYRAPGTLLRLGDRVTRGAVVGQIDSMRILNPVTAEEDGVLMEALVEDGDPVEYGQGLFVLGDGPDMDGGA